MRNPVLAAVTLALVSSFTFVSASALADDTAPQAESAAPTKNKKAAKKPKGKKVAPTKKVAKKAVEPVEPEIDVASTVEPEVMAPPVTIPAAPRPTPTQPPAAAVPVGTTTTTSVTLSPVSSPAADQPAALPVLKPVSDTGPVFSLGLGTLAPVTALTDGDERPSPGVSLELRGGYYVGRHVGLVAGLRFSFGHSTCDKDAAVCTAFSYQVPVVIQIAASRTSGIYGEAGLGLFTGFGAGNDDARLRISTPSTLKAGLGYRIGGLIPGRGVERGISADIRLGADVGAMNKVSVESRGETLASESIDKPAPFVLVGLNLNGHFSL